MSALLAPLLAQLVTIGIADRTEARYLEPNSYRYEGSTRPSVRLQLLWPRYSLSFGYGAALTLQPLESKPRDLLVYHTLFVSNSYTYRRTNVSLNSSASFGEVNFRTQALGTPAAAGGTTNPNTPNTPNTPTGQPPTGNTQDPKPDPSKPSDPGATPSGNGQLQQRVLDRPVSYGSLTNTLGVSHSVDRSLRLFSSVSYTLAGGLSDDAKEAYPLTRGTVLSLGATYTYFLSRRDALATSVVLQQAWSSIGNQVTTAYGTETITHRFDRHTTGTLGAGVSISRTPFGDRFSAYSVFPTFTAFVTHDRRLWRGTLTMSVGAYSAPSLDPLRATVDPRLGTTGSIGWTRDRFSARVSGGGQISIADSNNNAGAFNTLFAGVNAGYRLTSFMQVDAGGALAEQAYQDKTTVPLSYAAFVGVTFGVAAPIAGSAANKPGK